MGYSHISTDDLHGDERDYERMVEMAECTRDIDGEIDRKQDIMDAEDAKRDEAKRKQAQLVDFRYRCSQMISDLTYLVKWSDTPNGIHDFSADNVATQAERLQALCKELAK